MNSASSRGRSAAKSGTKPSYEKVVLVPQVVSRFHGDYVARPILSVADAAEITMTLRGSSRASQMAQNTLHLTGMATEFLNTKHPNVPRTTYSTLTLTPTHL